MRRNRSGFYQGQRRAVEGRNSSYPQDVRQLGRQSSAGPGQEQPQVLNGGAYGHVVEVDEKEPLSGRSSTLPGGNPRGA
jgi:hypothetical protein